MFVASYATNSTTLIINSRVISDFVDGDNVVLTSPNPLTSRNNGAKNSVSISKRSDGNVRVVKFNIVKHSDDDVWLNNLMNTEFPTIFNGSLKEDYKVGDEVRKSSWTLEGGSFTDQSGYTTNNTDGNITVEYTIEFRNGVLIK